MKRLAVICFLPLFGMAQQKSDSTNSSMKIEAYTEVYYVYDFGNPSDHNRPDYVFCYNRHNEFDVNMAMIKASYTENKSRANIALMAGTYPNVNLAAEPGVLKNIFEANGGIRLGSKELWIDAGIIPAHIGFESAVGKNCWTLTRSLMASNSPFYESGLRLSYTSANSKWYLAGLVLNGWQRIRRPDGNNSPAFGHQLTFTPSDKVTLNSSSFVGNDNPDSTMQMRYFHDFYGIFQFSEKFGFTVGFDAGIQETAKNSGKYYSWYAPVMIMKYAPGEKISLSGRAEYYSDEHNVITTTGYPVGFRTFGFSLNLDVTVSENAVWRIEGREFMSDETILILDRKPSGFGYMVATSLAISF